MAQPLAGKTAVVTGASSGIGRATAVALAAAGAHVVAQARRGDRLDAVVAEIEERKGRALAVVGDAGSEADVDALLDRARQWSAHGRVDVVVVNAGRGLAGGLLGSDPSAWAELYRVNVLGAAWLMRRAAEHMRATGAGDIVVIGSVVGRNVSPFGAFYGSTKFAIGAMAEGLRREVCGSGVRVSLVMPGLVMSEFQGVAGYTEDFEKSVARWGEPLRPESVAEAVAWLLGLPRHVNVSDITVRPTGQDYP